MADEAAAAAAAAPAPAPTPEQLANATIERAVKLLAETKGDAWVNKAPILNMVRRLDPTFDPKEFGHPTFSAMLKKLEGTLFDTRKGVFDQQLRLRTPVQPDTGTPAPRVVSDELP